MWNFTTPHTILMMAGRRHFADTVCRGKIVGRADRAVRPYKPPGHSWKIHGIATPVCALARNDASILEPLRRGMRRMEEFMQTLQMVLYFQALKC